LQLLSLRFLGTVFATLAIMSLLELSTRSQALGAISESVLWSFGNGLDGAVPDHVIVEAGGNLFGVTQKGGANGGGTVFELSPPSSNGGNWTESVLWSFGNDTDGSQPQGLVMDSNGNIFGGTSGGGTFGGGTVFELTPPSTSGGSWTESILWSFGNSTDGNGPDAGVIIDGSGNLYGTTNSGGINGKGTVFALTPPSTVGGAWTESVLWNFADGSDGAFPQVGVIIDQNGNLFGTTHRGGINDTGGDPGGTAFQLTPPASVGGNWTESILWNFGNGSDSKDPASGLAMDNSGNLYGTAFLGGTFGLGTIYTLKPPSTSGGAWSESILHSFGKGNDAMHPSTQLILDAGGNLYGVTFNGGIYGPATHGYGTAFKLKAPATSRGKWTESILWNFGIGDDGTGPATRSLTRDANGNLFGATEFGGAFGSSNSGGTVFEITSTPPFTPTVVSASAKVLNFGKLLTSQTSKPKKVVLTNKGRVPAQISDVGVTAGASAPFKLAGGSDSCSGESVSPKKTCSFFVEFEPTVAGTFNSADYTIRVTYNGASPVIGLQGTANPNIP
jgi:uncharacterized repeat protein (TIGR03803 family)